MGEIFSFGFELKETHLFSIPFILYSPVISETGCEAAKAWLSKIQKHVFRMSYCLRMSYLRQQPFSFLFLIILLIMLHF